MADDLQGTTHAEGCHTWGPRHYECALAALARKDAEIAALKLERDDFANACEHSADDLRARDAEIAHEEQRIKDLMDAISAADKEIAELCAENAAHFVRGREWATRCGEQEDRAERAEARVMEAPVADVYDYGAGSSDAWINCVVPIQWSGKRVALVLLDTEEAK